MPDDEEPVVVEDPRFGRLVFTKAEIPDKAQRRPARGLSKAARPRAPHKPTSWTMLCPNCDTRFSLDGQPRALYCSPRCQNEADVVRYARRKAIEYPDPSEMPDDIIYAIRIQIAWALVGGYDRNARRIPPGTRALVKERDGGLCVFCGAPGEEIDHIMGPSNDPANLRLLCHDCHRTLTESRLLPRAEDGEDVDEPSAEEEADESNPQCEWLMERITSDEPLLPSDADDWGQRWAAWRREYKEVAEA